MIDYCIFRLWYYLGGQMSFWAATVITNLFSAIPVIGSDLVLWLWSGYSVSGATLTKFYSLHFLFPFIIYKSNLISNISK